MSNNLHNNPTQKYHLYLGVKKLFTWTEQIYWFYNDKDITIQYRRHDLLMACTLGPKVGHLRWLSVSKTEDIFKQYPNVTADFLLSFLRKNSLQWILTKCSASFVFIIGNFKDFLFLVLKLTMNRAVYLTSLCTGKRRQRQLPKK